MHERGHSIGTGWTMPGLRFIAIIPSVMHELCTDNANTIGLGSIMTIAGKEELRIL